MYRMSTRDPSMKRRSPGVHGTMQKMGVRLPGSAAAFTEATSKATGCGAAANLAARHSAGNPLASLVICSLLRTVPSLFLWCGVPVPVTSDFFFGSYTGCRGVPRLPRKGEEMRSHVHRLGAALLLLGSGAFAASHRNGPLLLE